MSYFAADVYRFGDGIADGDGSMGELLGGKGAGLAEMTLLSLPVPSGFTITTDVCRGALQSDACKVRADADTPADAVLARAAGATGIGLCRTEHMFFCSGRLETVRTMILAESTADRIVAFDRLLPIQQSDFEAMFRTMSPLPGHRQIA